MNYNKDLNWIMNQPSTTIYCQHYVSSYYFQMYCYHLNLAQQFYNLYIRSFRSGHKEQTRLTTRENTQINLNLNEQTIYFQRNQFCTQKNRLFIEQTNHFQPNQFHTTQHYHNNSPETNKKRRIGITKQQFRGKSRREQDKILLSFMKNESGKISYTVPKNLIMDELEVNRKKIDKLKIHLINTGSYDPPLHGNTAKNPHNKFHIDKQLLKYLDSKEVEPWPSILNGDKTHFLPSHETLINLHKEFSNFQHVSGGFIPCFTTFYRHWNRIARNVKILPPQSDVCSTFEGYMNNLVSKTDFESHKKESMSRRLLYSFLVNKIRNNNLIAVEKKNKLKNINIDLDDFFIRSHIHTKILSMDYKKIFTYHLIQFNPKTIITHPKNLLIVLESWTNLKTRWQ